MTYIFQSPPRCVACGQLQGDPHAADCRFARLSIRRALAIFAHEQQIAGMPA